jgi:hypothetical protein
MIFRRKNVYTISLQTHKKKSYTERRPVGLAVLLIFGTYFIQILAPRRLKLHLNLF